MLGEHIGERVRLGGEAVVMRFNRVRTVILTVLSIVCSICSPTAEAKIIRVAETGNGADGLSWQTAFQKPSSAVALGSDGDEVWVKAGTYRDFILNESKVLCFLGGFSGTETDGEREKRDWRQNDTTIEAEGLVYQAFACKAKTVIDGFTLTTNNTTEGVGILSTEAVVRNCVIRDNISPVTGGGIYITDSTVELENCVIRDNESHGSGGGIYAERSTVTIEGCTITGNHAAHCGGMAVGDRGTIRNCVIANNIAYISIPHEESYSAVGGIALGVKDFVVENTLIYGNKSNLYMQMWALPSTTLDMRNCTIISEPEGIFFDTMEGILENCVFWGANDIVMNSISEIQIMKSCIQGGYTGLGNISDDPKFRNAAGGDFRLLPESPCIDTAGTSGPSEDLDGKPRPVDIAGIGREVTDTYDMGAYEFQQWELPKPAGVENWGLLK